MSKSANPFNPGRFDGALAEALYAKGFAAGPYKREREQLVRLLRTKHKDNDKAQALADKLEPCVKGGRCRLGACPECALASQKLATDDGERFTKNGKRSCRATDKQRLRSKERVRLAP